jgi:hypothetical protein
MMLRRVLGECFALFCAVMLGLAAGAVWLVPTVFLRQSLPWLALPIGWLLAVAIRQWVHGGKWSAVLLASVATVVACAYLQILTVATDLSAMMGYGLIDAMRAAGSSMLWDLARVGLGPRDIAWCVAGVIVAAITAARSKPRATSPVN